MCDTLTNTCGADQTAKNTCAQAKIAADGQPPKTGGQADGKHFLVLSLERQSSCLRLFSSLQRSLWHQNELYCGP